jgi:hypothetical protein
MNKNLVSSSLLLLISLGGFAQQKGHTATSDIIKAPKDWSSESFALPPSFATDFAMSGAEEVRFAPGWDNPASAQFWTYTFAWYLDGDARLTRQRLEKLVEDYFSGLTKSVGRDNGIAPEKIVAAKAQFATRQSSTFQENFRGTVTLLDVFFTRQQIKLNAEVKGNYCPEIDKHLIVFSFSPKAFQDDVWKAFDNVQVPQDCPALQEVTTTSFTTQKAEHYELLLPQGKQAGVLMLFPGFPETPDVVKREFKIVAPAMEAGIAVALMKFNRKLWLEDDEKKELAVIIERMFAENKLERDNVYIGGFSSGGTVSLLISDYLVASQSSVQPEGVFIIDSPVDLLGLHENSERNIKRNFSPVSVQESQMIVGMLESNFGKPEDSIAAYEAHSVYTLKTHNTKNVSHLRDVKLRFYTEPDTVWWKQNRQNEYEDMNAYFIKHLADDLGEEFGDNVAYIATENRGYRSTGERHPHAWSIVDVADLIRWITGE